MLSLSYAYVAVVAMAATCGCSSAFVRSPSIVRGRLKPCLSFKNLPRPQPSTRSGAETKQQQHQDRPRGRCCSSCVMFSMPPGEGKFFRMGGAEDAQAFGPRCILAGGLSPEGRDAVLSILEEEQDLEGRRGGEEPSIPLVLFTPGIADERVGDVLSNAAAISSQQEAELGKGLSLAEVSPLPLPMILVSGFTNPELRSFAARFRQVSGIRAAFAKAVPNAMVKPVSRLCKEIAQDHADALSGKLHGEQNGV